MKGPKKPGKFVLKKTSLTNLISCLNPRDSDVIYIMSREVEAGSHLLVRSGVPNIFKVVTDTLGQRNRHIACFAYI